MHKNWFKYTQWSPVEFGGVRWTPVDVVKGTDIYI